VREGHSSVDGLDLAAATSVAATLQGLATPSRLMLLATLSTHGPQTVGELTAAVAMEQSAVSHQLRVLRELGLVASERDGRFVIYRLHDTHVAELLQQAIHHTEHLRMEAADGSQAV
jgi:DNA-binding transcriptional ArsR family regulator